MDSQPVIVNRADGSILAFKRLAPSDRLAFRASFRLARKLHLFTNLHVCGITGDEAVVQLNAFDAKRLYEDDVEQWVNEPEGQGEAIALSLRKDHPKANGETDEAHAARVVALIDAMCLSDSERLSAAAGVMGMVVTTRAKEDKPENPPAAASETEPTGGGSPGSSPGTFTPPPIL